jgi:hypothetical protein
MPAAIAIPALISAGSSIVGGVMQHRAASSAEQAQVNATEGATRLVNDATAQVNPELTQGALTLGNAFRDVATTAGTGVRNAAGAAGAGVTAAAQQANGYLNPYVTAGGDALTKLSEIASGPGFTFSQDDPSYQWRLTEGQKALERSAAARGALQAGGTMKAITRYAQGAASQEYGAAFDRYMRERQTNAGIYSSLAGIGLTAGSRAGDNLTGAARYAGDTSIAGERYAGDASMEGERFASGLNWDAIRTAAGNSLSAARYGADALTGAGDARAAGAVARGNAWNGAIGGVANSAAGAFTMRDLMRRNPAAPGTYPTLPSTRGAQNVAAAKMIYGGGF